MNLNRYVSETSTASFEYAGFVSDLCGFDDVDMMRYLYGVGQ